MTDSTFDTEVDTFIIDDEKFQLIFIFSVFFQKLRTMPKSASNVLNSESEPRCSYEVVLIKNTSLVAPGALAHRLQRPTACNTSPPTLSKMADGVWKYVKPYVIGPSDQLLLNKFFDSIIPSMRASKIQNGH